MDLVIHHTATGERQSKHIQKPEVWIGRGEDCDIQLRNHFVSNKHARLTTDGAQYFIEAFGTNGTFCNAFDLERGKKYKLKARDEIKIADYEIVVLQSAQADEAGAQQQTELVRQVMAVEQQLHAQLLQRMDLRGMQLRSDDHHQARTIRRQLDAMLEERVDTLDTRLRDAVVRMACKRELLLLIDAGATVAAASHDMEEANQLLVRRFEEGLREAIRRLVRALGLRLQRDSRKADLERLETGFSRTFSRAGIDLTDPLARYIVKRWFYKELSDIIFGLGPLQDLLNLSTVSEIMVVNRDQIYIEQNGVIEDSGRRFLSDDMVLAVLERIVSPVGRRIDRSVPLVDARLPDGSRVNAIIPPLAVSGPCITIRKFARRALTAEDLVSGGAFTAQVAGFLKACVVGRKNLVVSGGTGSGKTTLLNVLSSFIPPQERIVTIEDSAELKLFQKHVVTLEARPANVEGSGAYTIRDLVKNALRMRPDRIIVGECRGGEALDMLQAMNTGHDGSMTTGHANTPQDMMLRLETMVLMAVDMPVRAIRQQIASAVDLVVQMERFAGGQRKVTSIAEVVGVDAETGELILEEIFRYTRLSADGPLMLAHTGYIPTFAEDLLERNMLSLEALFG
jgi:Flp pilus assembly CpaF family ATPase/pSer/pThr/pTyr-binding forkhead associated (FHA) protein